jgi:hypothetical protein
MISYGSKSICGLRQLMSVCVCVCVCVCGVLISVLAVKNLELYGVRVLHVCVDCSKVIMKRQ